ncbi:WYL domain-containing protein [Parabacteroides distasonis]|uniref:WYL domain-containing protein n=1 Tax=Parabacteroides distasonis TaxID=823 RepID=UPI0018A105C2|nr:WYL domain-containing protein [Parabacteroides distasonis]MDB9152573.1 WYL domain-containing protein [Parabacteroides distasonis]MDB9157149.1 WYL domain-containing protein [Parabacteroides distasonis]MDB9166163.1 WYL domain-containing protein [Parabacteroides distasonis]MDB9170583.1 WYL domain-containing protein [Parabacteroides distasonis]MDB9193351.1 WYL domain-containing protein [Parabacteroides distasonis]
MDYIRSVPLHPSQEEVETTNDYTIFRYDLRPSYDLMQYLLWHRENLEVLQPASLREEMRKLLQKMLERYLSASV